jgi:hypothetical protein
MLKGAYHEHVPAWRRRDYDPGAVKIAGIELEHEAKDVATMQRILAGADAALGEEVNDFVAEVDGSIDRLAGTEFISKPFPFRTLLAETGPVRKMLRYLLTFEPKPQRDNVGLHVSLNARAYRDPDAIAWFFGQVPRLCTTIAGRAKGFTKDAAPWRPADRLGVYRYGKYSAAWVDRGRRIEVRIHKSPDTDSQLHSRMLFTLTAAQYADENAPMIRNMDKEATYADFSKTLTEGYLRWLEGGKSVGKKKLLNELAPQAEFLLGATDDWKKKYEQARKPALRQWEEDYVTVTNGV